MSLTPAAGNATNRDTSRGALAEAGIAGGPPTRSLGRVGVLHVAFWVGFTSLVYEVYSAKVLFLFFVETTHAVALTLSAFLAGLGASSWVFSRRLPGGPRGAERVLVGLQLAGSAYALLVLRNYEIIPRVVDASSHLVGTGGADAVKIAFAWLFLFVPGFFVGGAFPILTGMFVSSVPEATRDTGTVYFWDTLGAIVGALAAGFVLLPFLGLVRAVAVPVVVNFVLVAAIAARPAARIAALAAAAATLAYTFTVAEPEALRATAATTPSAQVNQSPLDARFGRVRFRQDSPFGVITVGDDANGLLGDRVLFINYRDMCHSLQDESERVLAETTVGLLSPGARVLNIGLGCGFTAGSIAESAKVDAVEIAEINPVVARAAREHFADANARVLDRDKTRLYLQDGAELLRRSDRVYDAIVIDIEEPTVVYSSPLYTRDYFEIARGKLTRDGVLAVWAIGGDAVYAKILYNTAKSVFPHVRLRVVASHLHVYASARPLELGVDERLERPVIDRILATPSDEVNTLDNRALERRFDIRKTFRLPPDYREEFVRDGRGSP